MKKSIISSKKNQYFFSFHRDVPLPSGYETHHANLFIKYTFPAVVNDLPQTGKTKLIAGTASPDFGESIMLNIGSGKSRNSKLQRTFKRGGLKFEVLSTRRNRWNI